MGKVRLGDICTIRKGTKIEPVEHCKSAIRFIQIDDLRNDGNVKYCLHEKRYVTAKPEDIIIAWDGANAGTIGFGLEGAIGSTLALITLVDKSIDTRYLGLFLKGSFSYLRSICTGATIPHIHRKSLDDIKVPKYPLEDQRKIAETLDVASELLAMRKKQLAELDKLIQSVFYELFGDPVMNEKGWEVKPLGKVCTITSSKRIFESEYVVEGVPFYRTKEIVALSKGNQITNELFISQKRYDDIRLKFDVPSKNDILISAVGTIGVTWVVPYDYPFYFKDGNLLWIKSSSNLNSVYLNFLLGILVKYYTANLSVGSAYNALTIIKLNQMIALLPPLPLQTQFAETVQKIEEQKSLVQKAIDETQALFDSLMNEYFE